MTKEITKAFVLQQIQDKFKLREFDEAKFLFDETVVPIYDVGVHLSEWEVLDKELSINQGPHLFSALTVPQDERWTVRAYMVIFVTGSYTVAGVMMDTRKVYPSYIYLDLKAGQNASYLVTLPTPVVAEKGTRFGIYIDGYTSTGNIQLHLDTLVEKIR